MVYIDGIKKGSEYIYWTNTLNSYAEEYCTKEQLIKFINDYGNGSVKTKYLINDNWHIGEDVHIVDGKFLRTDPNKIKADNLSKLAIR